MRIVIIGAGELGTETAKRLLERDHEVIIIETDRERIEELSETVPCGFLHGDGSKPEIQREAGPKETDILYCLTDDDRVNIIASVVGRTSGFQRIITRITDSEFEDVCAEIGLEDVVIPTRTVGRFLADIVEGVDVLELSTLVKGDARFYSFTVPEKDAGKQIRDLDLPSEARVICYYRGDEFHLSEPEEGLAEGDEVVIVTHSRNLPELRKRWEPRAKEGASNSDEKEKSGDDR